MKMAKVVAEILMGKWLGLAMWVTLVFVLVCLHKL